MPHNSVVEVGIAVHGLRGGCRVGAGVWTRLVLSSPPLWGVIVRLPSGSHSWLSEREYPIPDYRPYTRVHFEPALPPYHG